MKESDIRKEIRDWLESKYIFCWPNLTVGIPDGQGGYRKHPMPGISDISGVLPNGKALAIEVKVKGHVTKKERLIAQTKFISRVNSNNGIGFFAYSLSEVKSKLEPILINISPEEMEKGRMWFYDAKVLLDGMGL